MMVENKHCDELMIDNHWVDKFLKKVLMIDYLSIVESDKVNHDVETDMVKLVVDIKSFGMCADELDKETGSSNGLQPKQADLSCVHALMEPHLHVIHVVPNKHEANQFESRSWILQVVSEPRGSDLGLRGFRIVMMAASVFGIMVGSASHMVIHGPTSWFLLVVPAGRLCGSYWSAYGFFCLPCSILFVIAASIIGPQTPLDLEQ
ncbi:hypothetical protein Tco_0522731 [Tanacetum coccineum]